MVSKENYEIWMLDYLDGILSDTDKVLLFQFLERNPHLKEELKNIENVVVNPQDEVFASKHALLKGSSELADMSYPDYVAIKEVESSLDSDELQWKSSYLKQDKSRTTLFELYSKVTLRADKSIRYPLKNSLKRVILVPRLTVSIYKRIGAAAAVALLILVGSWPFIQKVSDNSTIVAVNDNAMPILKPKTNAQVVVLDEKKVSVAMATNHSLVSVENQPVLVPNPKSSFEKIEMEPLSGKKMKLLKTQSINAYELGLNAMMPIVIANNLADIKDERLVWHSQLTEQSEQLNRKARVVTGSIKFINFLAGNETKVNKVLNQDGQLVAYQVESDNISIRQRIRIKPVTN